MALSLLIVSLEDTGNKGNRAALKTTWMDKGNEIIVAELLRHREFTHSLDDKSWRLKE